MEGLQGGIGIPAPGSVEGWLAEAARIEEVHALLVEKHKHLETLRIEMDSLDPQQLVVYELRAGKQKILCKDVGEGELGQDFWKRLEGQWVGIVDPEGEGLLKEGFIEPQQAKDVCGFFKQEDQGNVYFGFARAFEFEGPLMSSLPNGEKIVTFIKDGISDGNSKCILPQEIRYVNLKEGEYVDGSCLIIVPQSKFRVFTRIKNQGLDQQGVSTVILPNNERISGKLINLTDSNKHIGPETSLYNGTLKEGLPSGKGTLVLLNAGQVFEGVFTNGKLNGRGKYIDYIRLEQFEGNFAEGRINGQGTHKADGKWTYEGNFVDGKYQGQGTFLYEHQGKYSGEFIDGRFEGKGRSTSFAGNRTNLLSEHTIRSKMLIPTQSLRGRLYTPDGDFIEGQFKDSLPDGPVVLKNSKGEEFTAKVQDGQLLSDAGIELSGDIQKQLAEMARQRDENKAASLILSNFQ